MVERLKRPRNKKINREQIKNMNFKKALLIGLGIFIGGFILFIIGVSKDNMVIGLLGLITLLFSPSPIVVIIYRYLQKRFRFGGLIKVVEKGIEKEAPNKSFLFKDFKEIKEMFKKEGRTEPKTTKQCSYCQSEIPLGAKKCPQCQSDLRSWFSRHPILTFLIFCFVIGWMTIIIGGSMKKEGYIQKIAETPQQETQREIPIEISLDQLKAEYDANQLAADAKYKGKLLKFSAIIRNISKDIVGRPMVSLTTRKIRESFDIFSAVCYFKRGEESKLIGLKNEQIVTVIGRNDGMTVGVLSFKDCDIQYQKEITKQFEENKVDPQTYSAVIDKIETYKLPVKSGKWQTCIVNRINSLSNIELLQFQHWLFSLSPYASEATNLVTIARKLGCPEPIVKTITAKIEIIKSWQGTGSKNLGSFTPDTDNWVMKITWQNSPFNEDFGNDEFAIERRLLFDYGIIDYEEGASITSSPLISAFYSPSGSEERPSNYLGYTHFDVLRVKAPEQATWKVEIYKIIEPAKTLIE